MTNTQWQLKKFKLSILCTILADVKKMLLFYARICDY